MLTRCPHCSASFRVSDAQLQAARGKVRCGACMKVFNASEHLLTDDPAPAKPAPSPATSPAAPAKKPEVAPGISQDDDLFAAMDDDDHSLDDLTEALTAAGDEADDELVFQDDPEEDQADESYSGGLLDESELSDSFRDLERPEDKPKFEFEGSEEEETGPTDESWAEQMLRELEKPPAPPQSSASAKHTSSAPETPAFELESDSPAPAPVPQPRGGQSAAPKPHPLETTLRADRDNPYHSLRADPISVGSGMQVEQSTWVKPTLWGIAIIALIVFLVLQLAWFHFDKLARYDQLRPVYAKACEMIGCQLPSLYDIKQIKSRNLVVRSHPLVNKALIIDAIVINEASFEQPFPEISLNFSDINNNIVAQRRFTPAEYLSGEAKGMQVMPPGVSIHIALEILDPGKEAVNYTLEFIPTHPPEA